MSRLYDTYNDDLCWLVSHMAFLNVTQKPLGEEDYNKAVGILNDLRAEFNGPDELQAENDALKAHVERLREAALGVDRVCCSGVSNIAVTGASYRTLQQAIAETPAQSLAAHDAALIGECADLCQVQGDEWDSDAQITDKNYAEYCAEALRKKQEEV